MPKIPMSDRAGFIRHTRDTVPMQGAPGMEFGMGESRALIDMGDRLGRGAERLGSAMMHFAREMQHQEDVLAATQDRNLYKRLSGELNAKLAENPDASDDEKTSWISGYKQKFEDDRKPYLDKMSSAFRQRHDAEMEGIRISADADRYRILTQGRVTRLQNEFLTEYNSAAKRGDVETCRRMIAEGRSGDTPLISESMAKKLETDLPHMADFGEVQRLLEAGTDGMADKLKERDQSGNYVNFKNLTLSEREKFIRYAKSDEAAREAQNAKFVQAQFAAGDVPFDRAQLDEWWKNGQLSDGLFTLYSGWLDTAEKSAAREADYKASQKEKSDKALRQQNYDQFMNDVEFDENGYARHLDPLRFADAFKKLKTICGKDYDLFGRGLAKLNSLREKPEKIREMPIFKYGAGVIDQLKAQRQIFAVTGHHWWNGKKTGQGVPGFIERQLRIDLYNFCTDNPNASMQEVNQFITDRNAVYAKSTVDEIGAMALLQAQERREMRSAQGRRSVPAEGTTGMFNGKKVVVKDGKIQYQ